MAIEGCEHLCLVADPRNSVALHVQTSYGYSVVYFLIASECPGPTKHGFAQLSLSLPTCSQ